MFYLFLGLIFETKGPVGLLFPLFFIIGYKVVYKDTIERNIHLFLGLILFLTISVAWYIALIIDKPELWGYFINHQLKDRMVSNSFNRSKPFWYYLLTVPLLALPWFIILMVQLKTKFSKIINERKITMVLYATILAILVVFSFFKTKLIFYVMPMFGFMAILTAKMLLETTQKSLQIYNKILIGLGSLFLISILVINVIGVEYHFDFTQAIVLTCLAIIVYFLISKYQSGYLKTATLSYLLGAVLLLGGNGVLAHNEDLLNSTKPVTEFIDNNLSDIENILVYDYLMPSVKFNSNKTVITLNDGHNTVQRETQFETDVFWKDHLLDLKTETGRQKTDSLLQRKSVLISRKKEKLPNFLEYLNHTPYNKKEFGKWVIYY
jgi:4-amino-4-deoxy-L-arabinose transferase